MIIGRAGGLGDGPREKVAGTEEQIDQSARRRGESVRPWGFAQLPCFSTYGKRAIL